MFQLVQTAQQGWECPKCNRVYSPTTMMCVACPVQTVTTAGVDIPVTVTGDSITITPCDHDWNENMTAPSCRRCGTMKPADFSWTPTILYPLGTPNT
jgi:RNA polymerase subunit RPABC4/transcription elongation factor Spt4